MMRSLRFVAAAAIVGGVLAACADQSPMTAPSSASFAKSGTAPSGGGSGGGGGGSTTPTDTTKSATPTPIGGEPIAPTYIGYITTMGVVPAGFYYGTPSGWQVNGYPFAAVYTTSYKPVNGAITLGACVSINFYMSGTERVMQEMKTLDPSKCK